MKQVD